MTKFASSARADPSLVQVVFTTQLLNAQLADQLYTQTMLVKLVDCVHFRVQQVS